MLPRLRLENFKSWKDTQDIALRPIAAMSEAALMRRQAAG